MRLFSCFKKKKDTDNIRGCIKNFILNYMDGYCKANPRNTGSATIICSETIRCVYAFSDKKFEDAMKECNVSVEDAALSLIQLNARTYINERLKLEEDAESAYKFYGAVINERYERGFITKDQYEADLSYEIS